MYSRLLGTRPHGTLHGIARARGLHARADRLALVVEMLGVPGTGIAQASALVDELQSAMKQEAELIQAAPQAITRGSEDSLRAMRQRLNRFSQLQLMLHNEQVSSAKQHASVLARQLRSDASRVTDFATQGVYVPPHSLTLMPIVSAETVQKANHYAPRWARTRALLVASEKVAQVLHLVRHGRRRSLQEGVQLLVTMEESDMATLFQIAREIMRATDTEHLRENATRSAAPAAAPHKGVQHAANRAPTPETAVGKTTWWHQIDDENDETYEVKDFSEWHATRDLRTARLHLMNNRAIDGVSALEKLRGDLLLYARDAA